MEFYHAFFNALKLFSNLIQNMRLMLLTQWKNTLT